MQQWLQGARKWLTAGLKRFKEGEIAELVNDKNNKNAQKGTKIKISFNFIFRMFELKRVAKIMEVHSGQN